MPVLRALFLRGGKLAAPAPQAETTTSSNQRNSLPPEIVTPVSMQSPTWSASYPPAPWERPIKKLAERMDRFEERTDERMDRLDDRIFDKIVDAVKAVAEQKGRLNGHTRRRTPSGD